MNPPTFRATPTDASTTIQIAISPKGLDATAITAADTVRRLLGFGDRLAELRRQRWIEMTLDPAPDLGPARGADGTADLDPVLLDLDRYLGSSFSLWNPNKERCWVRLHWGQTEGPCAEFVPHLGRRQARWGDPGLDGEDWDHLVIWEAGSTESPVLSDGNSDAAGSSVSMSPNPAGSSVSLSPNPAGPSPADPRGTTHRFGDTRVGRLTSGEVYSFRWGRTASESDRRRWIDELAVARTREHGLLVQPHYQDHAVYCGPLPRGLGCEPA